MKRLALVLCVTGCAHASSDAALGDLQTRLTDAQRKEADARRRIDELENRVFLMTDQLESHKVATAASHAPRLPVVTLRPSEDNARAEDEVEFTGAASTVDAHHVRPTLRGEGESSPVISSEPRARARSRAAVPSAEPSVRFVAQGGGDSLGVAPVPPIPRGSASDRPRAQSVAPALPAAERAPVEAEPLAAYRAAYGELTAGRYDEAERQLRGFVKRYPRHDYADNAQYWLGECFYARHRYQEAAIEFRAAVAKYPVGNKAPDALLKLAYSLLALGETAEAKRMLEELPSTYPRSDAARLASGKLAELGGHALSSNPSEDSR